MKSLVILIFLAITGLGSAQSLYLDPTFGDSGKKIVPSSYFPLKVFYEDNKYFFVYDKGGLCSINYDGSIDNTFGTNGQLFFTTYTSGETYLVKGAKLQNGFFYIYGNVTYASDNSKENVFVIKVSKTGMYDNTFGENGKKIIDLGPYAEVINDIVIKTDGTIYGTGTKTTIKDPETKTIFLVKLTSTGELDLTFSPTGHKLFSLDPNEDSIGASIYEYQNNLLLVGSSAYPINKYAPPKYLVLLKIDSNGNYVTSFGTNGIKQVKLSYEGDDTAGYRLENSVLISNNLLYFQYYYAWSFINRGSRLSVYDLDTGNLQKDISGLSEYHPFYYVDANYNIYSAGSPSCGKYSTANHCGRSFMLSKKNPDGTPDTNFNGTGSYSFKFNPGWEADDQSSVFYIHNDGKILLAGYSYYYYYPDMSQGLGMVRLTDKQLSTGSIESPGDFSVYPNPTQGEIFIQNKTSRTIDEVCVIDILGKEVLNQKNNFETVDIRKLPKGMYILKIVSEDTASMIKIIKE